MDLQKLDKENHLVSLFHQKNVEIDFRLPFERDIFLFDTYVAGVMHIETFEEIEPDLQIGMELVFIREPENPYDSEAINIQTQVGQKIGYVPKKDNVIFARLMDAGKLLVGKIQDKKQKGKWTKIGIGIYLRD
ncbi:restriction endonuclease [Streptococcus sp. zg-86]|uniref:Restriction endonuclease n=1 Tax=Streptococcus zhangguiae TaxID=2664091 RepID=A0A6I4R8V4_9STRE|nr:MULTISPECIES: HIRAN domain-containing protein [unclassified Streptococcus]MTB64239.1 restriction endonuclease [Streptococcus sp. zg-86]MTB90435.1 restriction endonuclease [Streptococcus sp. zg-36]MWV56226.1 restriction endonuclease [Streptococcus sp. zg-70]QTH48152.1 HIRAN domain-containing protein [Streptococcus sp. zg-86]